MMVSETLIGAEFTEACTRVVFPLFEGTPDDPLLGGGCRSHRITHYHRSLVNIDTTHLLQTPSESTSVHTHTKHTLDNVKVNCKLLSSGRTEIMNFRITLNQHETPIDQPFSGCVDCTPTSRLYIHI